ncbi:MAG: autorepressor SdpR family transcription factor [Pirellulaceae bacterium]
MASIFKALADPTRRKILQLLRARPMTAGELSEQFPFSRPTMSAHFNVLKEAELIDSEKQGTTITYRLKLSVLEDALLEFASALKLELGQTRKSRRSSSPKQQAVPASLKAGKRRS